MRSPGTILVGAGWFFPFVAGLGAVLYWGAPTLARISLEFMRCSICGSVTSDERSHSQALEASGRPKTVRKYDSKALSGSCTARVPPGIPENEAFVRVT